MSIAYAYFDRRTSFSEFNLQAEQKLLPHWRNRSEKQCGHFVNNRFRFSSVKDPFCSIFLLMCCFELVYGTFPDLLSFAAAQNTLAASAGGPLLMRHLDSHVC